MRVVGGERGCVCVCVACETVCVWCEVLLLYVYELKLLDSCLTVTTCKVVYCIGHHLP